MGEPTQRNPDLDMPDVDDAVDTEEQEIVALQDWLENTPEGREVAQEADKNPEVLQYYPRWQEEGETHEESLQSWSGAPRRVGRYIRHAPRGIENTIYDPLGPIGKQYEQHLEDDGFTGHARAAMATGWDVVWEGLVLGTLRSVRDVSRGQFDGEQLFHVLTMGVGYARPAMARGLMMQLARKTAVGAGRKFHVPKLVWDEVVKELSPDDIRRLERAKILDRRIERAETGLEVVSLTLEAEEWLHEMIGTGIVRAASETSTAFLRRPDPDASPETEETLALLPGQPELPPGQPELPPGEPAPEAIPLGPEAGVEPEPKTLPDVINLPSGRVEPEIEPEGGSPDADTQPEAVEPDVPESGSGQGTQSVSPDVEGATPGTDPEGVSGTTVEPDSGTEGGSAEYQTLVDQVANFPGVNDPEVLASTIEALRPQIEALPEYQPADGRANNELIAKLFRDAEQRVGEMGVPESTTPEGGMPTSNPLDGTPHRTVYSSDRKQKFRTRYGLMELDAMVPSHLLDGKNNPKYAHPNLQPREERGSVSSLALVDGYAREMETAFFLNPFATTSDGAPILSYKHPPLVVSGNGRTMGLQKAFRDYPQSWSKYQRDLITAAPQYGITPDEINGMQKPVLVQFLDEEVNENAFADDANKKGGMAYTSVESASSDAQYLTDDIMVEWALSGESFEAALESPDNGSFREALLKKIPSQEHPTFKTGDGRHFSEDGIKRIRNMMMRYVFSGDYGLALSKMVIETKFDAIKNIQKMLDVAIPHLAFIESYTRHGLREPNLSIAEELARAVGTLDSLVRNGEKVGDFVAQDLLFMPQTTLDHLSLPALEMLVLMDEKQRGYQQLASVFMRYTLAVEGESLPGESLVGTQLDKADFFEREIRQHFNDNIPPDILKWKEKEEKGDKENKIPPRIVTGWEVDEKVQIHVENLIAAVKSQAQTRALPEPEPVLNTFEGGEPEVEVDRTPRPTGPVTPETQGVAAPEVSPDAISPPDIESPDAEATATPEIEVPSVEGVEPEIAPEGVDLTAPEPRQPPPNLPINPNLKLVDVTPEDTAFNTKPVRTYVLEERPDVEVRISSEGDGFMVTPLVPGYLGGHIYVEQQGTTDIEAESKRAILEALASEDFRNLDWELNPDDPMLHGSIDAPTEVEQARIDKMPHLKQGESFTDLHTNTDRGVAFQMPGLDPAMKIKTLYEGEGRYTVYIESEAYADALENFELPDSHPVNISTENGDVALVLREIPGVDPMDALKRGLARVLDDMVWDDVNTVPEPDAPPLQKKGVPGNEPDPLPDQIKLIEDPQMALMRRAFLITDQKGKRINGYRVSVNPDPMGLDDGVMEVTLSFPNHNAEDLVEHVHGNTPEEAAMNAIGSWRQFEWDMGGIGTPNTAEPEHTPLEAGESLFEDLPPVIKSSEQSFGNMVKDAASMELEGLAKTGVLQIYKFAASHAPEVRIRKMGDADNPEWHIELRHHRRNAAHHVSYQKGYQAAITEAIETIEASDHEWKPLYKSGIFAEVDGIINAVNRRQFATTPAVERRIKGVFTNMRRGLKIDLRGYKLTTLKELVVMAQVFRNPKFESSRIFYLDSDMNIVGHDMTAFGIPASTGVVPHSRIDYMMRQLGASYFVDMHNHPSGNTKLSKADRGYMASISKTFGSQYIGSVVVNTGEYTEVRQLEYPDKQTGEKKYKIQPHERRRLSSADLGWDTGADPAIPQKEVDAVGNADAFSSLETVIRPSDPLYQYDVETPNGKMVQLGRKVGEQRDYKTLGNMTTGDRRQDIAKLGKYLQTEKNWTTLFFTNFAHEILSVNEYKDLHRLDGNELWNFINTEARKHGGVYVSAYVGEGDWYKTKDDINRSSWGAIAGDTDVTQRGLEHTWFAGLDESGVYSMRSDKKMLLANDDMAIVEEGDKLYSVLGMGSGILESQTDADWGIDTGLTEGSAERTSLIKAITERLEAALPVSIADRYDEAFGDIPIELANRIPIVETFMQMVTNNYIFNRGAEIRGYSPTEAVDMYKAMMGMQEQSGIDPARNQATRGAAYLVGRLANISEKDTVLTMGDVEGMLATFASLHGAGKVMTTTTDSYTAKLLDQITPGLTEVQNIEDTNIAREYKGDRPTVILLDGFDTPASKIDEAMKLLAPNGRLVVTKPLSGAGYMADNFWSTLQKKYPMYQILGKEQERSVETTQYIVIDKTRNTIGETEMGLSLSKIYSNEGTVGLDGLLAESEALRAKRIPVTPENAAVPFEGIRPEEQSFFTPIDNPYRPDQLRGEPEPLQELPEEYLLGDEPPLTASDSPSVNATPNSHGAPVKGVSDPPGSTPPPDDAPTGVSSKVKSWIREKFTDTNQKWYPISVQTAKVTLEKLGPTGLAIGKSLKRVRNVGDRFTGRGTSQLDNLFPKAEAWVKGFARDRGIELDTVIREFNQVLVRHHEGRSVQRVPKVMQEIVDTMKAWNTENIENPMLKMNQDILKQGLLFEMPESLITEKALTNEYRKELEMPLASFEKFMRQRKNRDEYGLVQGFVRHVGTGKVYAVRVKGDVFVDPNTQGTRISQKSVKYMLESPFGEKVEGDQTMLYDANDDYTLLASRNPASRRWTGNRVEAKEMWDAEIENNPRPDVLAQHFSDAGIQLPEGVRFVFRKVANLEEWSVRKEGQELYRIRRIVPIETNKKKGEMEEAHSAYNPFKHRLLVYDPSQARTPNFIYRGATAYKVWQPQPNYFPHIIDWGAMNPDPSSGKKHDRFVQYVQQFSDANAMEFDAARAILTQYISDSKTRKYGHLEQDRQYNFPAFNRNYFQVWEQYMARAGHRLQTIREFGQQNDLLTARLNEFVNEDTLTEPLTDSENAVLKARFYAGYQDFTPLKKSWKQEFRNDDGTPSTLDPNEGEYVGMGPGDWATLVENGILTALDDGTYQPTESGVAMLENPAFLHGSLMQGMRKMSVASDIVKNQLGWRQGDLFDEEMGDMIRGVQGWTGVLFLGRAWAANIAQSVNTAVVTDGRSLLSGIHAMIKDPKNRKWSREVGAVAIDVMHDYGSGSALGTRVLRQMLGAVPRYQMGESSARSVLPTEEVIDDFGVKIHAWTPFYHIERMNRVVASLASRAYAVGHIKDMINNPKDAKVAREQLISLPGAYALEGKLKEALSIGGLTVEDVEKVSEMLPDEVRQDAPHLWSVHDFLAEYAKETADWTQHRVEAMDRGRPWTNNPIFIMMQQLQSFNIAQTKFVKDQFVREWKIMHTALNQKDLPSLLQGKGAARALGSLWLVPRIVFWGGMFGIPTAILGKLIRFDAPDEDTIGLATGLYKAGMFTQLGEYMLQIQRWNRGAEEILLGPTLGTVADIAGDIGQGKPLRTVSRLVRPPLGGPSVKQIIEWTEPAEGGRQSRSRQRQSRSRTERQRRE